MQENITPEKEAELREKIFGEFEKVHPTDDVPSIFQLVKEQNPDAKIEQPAYNIGMYDAYD